MFYYMANNDKNDTESPDIIEEIIPGKNTDYNDKSINPDNNNNLQSFVEDYNEEESAQAVINSSEDSKRTMETSTEESKNQIPRYTQAITDTHEQTATVTKALADNYLEYQKQAINSFQSVYAQYFVNFQEKLWNNQEFFKKIPDMYSGMISSYMESAMAFNKIWNDFIISNVGFFNDLNKKAKNK